MDRLTLQLADPQQAHADLTRAALARLVLRLMAERQHMRMMDAARSQVRFL